MKYTILTLLFAICCKTSNGSPLDTLRQVYMDRAEAIQKRHRSIVEAIETTGQARRELIDHETELMLSPEHIPEFRAHCAQLTREFQERMAQFRNTELARENAIFAEQVDELNRMRALLVDMENDELLARQDRRLIIRCCNVFYVKFNPGSFVDAIRTFEFGRARNLRCD